LSSVIETSVLDGAILSHEARTEALERFRTTRSGREKPGSFWKIDIDAIDVGDAPGNRGNVTISPVTARGVMTCDLGTAARQHRALLTRALGKTGVQNSKFGALTAAHARMGAFIYVSSDVALDEPIVITYRSESATFFPYTVVLADRGARVTVIERIEAPSGALVCGASEIVSEDHADVTYAAFQTLSEDTRIVMSRAAAPGRNARVAWALADLGASLVVGSASALIEHEGAHVDIAALFFPRRDQHVDLVTTVSHDVGHATSETVVKSAAIDRGQARYLGNIRIAPHAQGSDASLRDDALLLSPKAHIDSIPALEIGANDVKAFHGATVGALDDDAIFYMESRGIPREQSERMIALGFFEPAIERFPTEGLREEIRGALRAKIG
jgi:FeS assembly protein SufD